MIKKSLSLVALAALLSACSAAAQNTASVEQVSPVPTLVAEAPPTAHFAPAARERAIYDDAAVTCDVRSRRTANGLLIQARLFADLDIDAEYDLRIVKSGGGNSSEINQSGEISLAAGTSATLGESEISVEHGSRVRAYLTVRNARGEICHGSIRL